MTLPPPGDPGVAEFVDSLVKEAIRDNNRGAWADSVQHWVDLYSGEHWADIPEEAGEIRVMLNRVQNCIISLFAIQAGDPPKITFTPRESGEPPLCYVNTNIRHPLLDQFIAVNQIDPSRPLPMPAEQQLRLLIAEGKQLKLAAMAMGQPEPSVLPDEALVEISDRTASDALQTVYDAMWEEASGEMYFSENVLNKNIFGWQPTLFEFDDVEQKIVLRNLEQKHVFLDPTRQDMRACQYAIYDDYLSLEQAIAQYPQIESILRDHAQPGTLVPPGVKQYDLAAGYDRQFERSMVCVRHCWVRSWPYPMTEDEAVASGRLIISDVPTGEILTDFNPQTQEPIIRPIMQQVLTLPDGSPAPAPGSAGWPKKFGIRYMKVIQGQTVEDRQAETGKIPIANNINIPVPFSPYGQGEPARLDGIQMAINRILSSFVTHQAYNAMPPEYIPDSVDERLGNAMKKQRAKWGKRVVVPDDLLQTLGDINKVCSFLERPQMPADQWKLLEFLVNHIDREGNQAEVLQGNASSTWSGEAINSLQNAASKVIQAKSRYTEFWLKYISELFVHAIVTRMEPRDLMRRSSKFPLPVWQAFHAKIKSLHIDISVEISSGSGASEQAKTTNIVGARNAGVPISDPTVIERLDLDPDAELQRQAQYLKKRGDLLPEMMQQQAEQQASESAPNNRSAA